MGTCVLYIGLVEAGYQSNFLLVASIYFGTDACIYIYIHYDICNHTHIYILYIFKYTHAILLGSISIFAPQHGFHGKARLDLASREKPRD